MTNYDKAIGTTYLGWVDYDQINYVSMNDLAAYRRPDFLGYSQMSSPLKIASFAYIFLYVSSILHNFMRGRVDSAIYFSMQADACVETVAARRGFSDATENLAQTHSCKINHESFNSLFPCFGTSVAGLQPAQPFPSKLF